MEDKLKPVINNGLRLDLEAAEQDGSEKVFGALSQPGIANIPAEQREMYLPGGEKQYATEDSQSCVSFAICNALEMQFTWLVKNNKLSAPNLTWLQENGYITPEGRAEFSDRWIAIKSNTTKTGNSLIAPLRAVREFGMIPDSLFPAPTDFTFDQYHDKTKLTQKMSEMGKGFKERFEVNYEQVKSSHMAEALKDDPLVVAAYGWPFPENGVYPPSDYPFNHAFILYALPKFQAFDQYLDEGREGDFTKNLSPNYIFYQHGYRLFISKENISPTDSITLSLWQQLLNLLLELEKWLKENPQPVPAPAPSAHKWDTVADARHSVRVICDEMGLTLQEKNIITAVIQAESGFKNTAKLENKKNGVTWSTDWGICQINDYYHVGDGKKWASVKQILDNPDKAVKWMIQMYKQGQLKMWVAYSSGSYKRYL